MILKRRRFGSKILSLLLIIGAVCTPLSGCGKEQKVEFLNDAYADYFTIGAAFNYGRLNYYESSGLYQHFGSLTAENEMKWDALQPRKGTFSWDNADTLVDFAVSKGMKVRGHALVWHNQAPEWIFRNNPSKQDLLDTIEDHIKTVMPHFEDRVYAWDVVNEAISDSANEVFRNSDFYRIGGVDFIHHAFTVARETSPTTKLFYNDYNMDDPVKRGKVIEMIKGMQDAGVPIDGVGMQGHYKTRRFNYEQFELAIEEFAELGLEVQITELDFSVYLNDSERFTELSPQYSKLQADAYAKAFEIMRKHKDVITGVTLWGLADFSNWLDNYPVQGRKDFPLLFDRNLDPKEAFFAVRDFK